MKSLFNSFVDEVDVNAPAASEWAGLVRDIEDMLNHCRMSNRFLGDELLDTSVLNYGLPPLNGNSGGATLSSAIAEGILRALRVFEPRLIPESIQVFPAPGEMAGGGILNYEIEAFLKAKPMRLCLQLNLDTHFGRAAVVTHSTVAAVH